MKICKSIVLLGAAAIGIFDTLGCTTKEVALRGAVTDRDGSSDDPKGDASHDPVHFPMPFCLSYADKSTAESCTACYDEWGTQTALQCKPSGAKCVARNPSSDTRCIYCNDNTTVALACLKCDVKDSVSGCAICAWSDTGTACKRCVDPSGVETGDCDVVRPELGP